MIADRRSAETKQIAAAEAACEGRAATEVSAPDRAGVLPAVVMWPVARGIAPADSLNAASPRGSRR
jgi:hypothetical protein